MTLTTCNGRINPGNGLCDNCYQKAMSSSNICGRLIPVEQPKQNSAHSFTDGWKFIESYITAFSTSNRMFRELLIKQAKEWYDKKYSKTLNP